MTTETTETPHVGDLLKGSPRNWGKWGPDDEVGSDSGEVFPVVVR